MSERLPDDILAGLIASFGRAIAEQRARVPANVAHVVEKTFNTAEWIRDGLAELRDRRARDFTDEDREALRTVRDHWGPPERESLPEIMEERRRVFAVLDKLIGGGS